MNTESIKEHIRSEAAKAQSIVTNAERQNRKLTGREMTAVKGHLATCARLKEGLDTRRELADAMRPIVNLGAPGSTADSSGRPLPATGTAGEQFTGSDAYRHLLTTTGDPSNPWNHRRVEAGPVQVGGMSLMRQVRNLVTGSSPELLGEATDGAGNLVRPDFAGLIDPVYARELKLVDLLTTIPASGDTVDFVQITAVDNQAAAVPEATDASTDGSVTPETLGNPGGYKPESGMTFAPKQEHIRTIAHTMPVTKKALADAPYVRVLIDTFLRYGLLEKVEDLILAGDGEGENLLGLANQEGTQVENGQSGDTIVDIARRAKLKSVLARGGQPTAYVLHPQDWAEYELLKDAEERYFHNGAFSKEFPRSLWGIPIVESEGVTPGTAWVANWKQAAYFDRQQASITASDSHADFFIRNLVMILAELRCGFGLLLPASFVSYAVAPVGE